MSLLNLELFRQTSLLSDPFPYAITPEFISAAAIPGILADFPHITQGGSFPLSSLKYGPKFAALCDALRGPEMRAAFAEKFQMDLSRHPTTLTVRGCCRAKDGQIHVDSKSKLITVLIYLNGLDGQAGDGGHLRLLRSEHNLNDYVAQVTPEPGKLLCFLNGPNAWHGHSSFTGIRRVLQLNWVTDEAAVRKSERRHGLSALFKRLNPFSRVA